MVVDKSQNLLKVKVLLLALHPQVVESQVNHIDPSQGQPLDVLWALVTHGAEEQVEPVSEHHGLIETLGAGLVEPLPAPVTLQHPQVPFSRPAAIAVALLLIGAVRRVPLELLGLVGQHHLHSLQSPGDGALLQCAAFPHSQREDAASAEPRSEQGPVSTAGYGDVALLVVTQATLPTDEDLIQRP